MQPSQEILDYIEKQWKWDEDLKQDVLIEILSLPDEAEINKSWCVARYTSRRINESLKTDNRRRLTEEHRGEIMELLHGNEEVAEDPLDLIVADEEMQDRLNGLSPLLRTTLDSVVIEGRTPEEVAEAQGTSANVIYKRIHDAKLILQGIKQ